MNLLFMIRVLLSLIQSFEILIGILLNQEKNREIPSQWLEKVIVMDNKKMLSLFVFREKKIIIEYKYSWIGS